MLETEVHRKYHQCNNEEAYKTTTALLVSSEYVGHDTLYQFSYKPLK